jgi:hypothetical protein
MRFVFLQFIALILGMAVCSSPLILRGQDSRLALSATVAADPSASALPDAPAPQIVPSTFDSQATQQPAPAQNQQPSTGAAPAATNTSQEAQQPSTNSSSPASSATSAAQNGAALTNSSSSSDAQTAPQQPDTPETLHQKAEEQIREQEHQRIAGILPSFNVSYRSDAVSLTAAEKFKLDLRAAIDPYTFGIAMITAGLGEAEDSDTGFAWGPAGYTERAAAAYGDNVIGNLIGNAVLPSILHQDPRYFRLGHGSAGHRLLYAAATSFICKHDNTGKWEPNYSNVLGNMIAGEISTLYYPNSKGDGLQAVETGLTVTFEGTFGAELQEFWPDISRRFFHKDPTHGLDAQARAADAAARQKKFAGSNLPAGSASPAQNGPLPTPPAPPAPVPAAKAL